MGQRPVEFLFQRNAVSFFLVVCLSGKCYARPAVICCRRAFHCLRDVCWSWESVNSVSIFKRDEGVCGLTCDDSDRNRFGYWFVFWDGKVCVTYFLPQRS